MTYRKGSAGAADAKQDKLTLIGVAIATILWWCAFFVFDTDLKKFTGRASTFDNIAGSILIFGSWFYLWWQVRQEYHSKGLIVWLGAIAFGSVLSCGFNFDYFGL